MNNTESFPALLDPVLRLLDLVLAPNQTALLSRHFELLLHWNRQVNLTAIRDPKEIVSRHFGESLFLGKALPADALKIVDIGSGAGFPGFPIAVLQPAANVTLVESVGKKAAFLKELARGVANVRVFHGRFEDVTDQFDCAVIRAVTLERLSNSIWRKTRRVAVLTRPGKAGHLGIDWDEQRPIPWDPNIVLLIGRSTWNSSMLD